MAKRDTGLTSKKLSHPHKTQKRLAAKRERLGALAKKRNS